MRALIILSMEIHKIGILCVKGACERVVNIKRQEVIGKGALEFERLSINLKPYVNKMHTYLRP